MLSSGSQGPENQSRIDRERSCQRRRVDFIGEEDIGVVELVRAHPKTSLSIAAVLTLAVGGIEHKISNWSRARQVEFTALTNELKDEPPAGLIAYSLGDEVRIMHAEELWKEQREIARFQVSTNPKHLLWISDSEVIFARPHEQVCNSDVELVDPDHATSIASDIVQILDFSNGELRTVIDPYVNPSSTFSAIFGDAKKKDLELANEKAKSSDDFFSKKKDRHGIRIRIGEANKKGTFHVEDIGKDPNTQELYVKVGDDWYRVQPNSNEIDKPVRIPVGLTINQEQSPEGRFHFEDPLLESLQVRKSGGNVGVPIEKGADSPAWRK